MSLGYGCHGINTYQRRWGNQNMKIRIPSYRSSEYVQVYKILEFRDGCIFRSENTGKFIERDKATKLDKTKFTTTSILTELTKQDFIEMEMFEI